MADGFTIKPKADGFTIRPDRDAFTPNWKPDGFTISDTDLSQGSPVDRLLAELRRKYPKKEE